MPLRIAATLLCLLVTLGWSEARTAHHPRRHRPAQEAVTVVPPFGSTPSDDFKDHPVPSGVPALRPYHRRSLHRHRP